MPDRYLQALLTIAQEDLPQLDYDLTNATTIYTLREAAMKMQNILKYLVHTAVLNIYANGGLIPRDNGQVQQAQSVQNPAPAPVVVAPHRHHSSMAPLPFARPPEPVQSPVTEVFVTASGTRAQVPGKPAMAFPPGVPVDTAQFAPQRPVAASPFHSVAPGHAPLDVTLPQGGGLSPEVAAALAGRSTGAPIMDGGARDITDDQAR